MANSTASYRAAGSGVLRSVARPHELWERVLRRMLQSGIERMRLWECAQPLLGPGRSVGRYLPSMRHDRFAYFQDVTFDRLLHYRYIGPLTRERLLYLAAHVDAALDSHADWAGRELPPTECSVLRFLHGLAYDEPEDARDCVVELLDCTPGRAGAYLRMRYGLEDGQPWRLKEIAEHYRTTSTYVYSQIQAAKWWFRGTVAQSLVNKAIRTRSNEIFRALSDGNEFIPKSDLRRARSLPYSLERFLLEYCGLRPAEFLTRWHTFTGEGWVRSGPTGDSLPGVPSVAVQ